MNGDFRSEGAAAIEWVARYLDGVAERRPVLAGVVGTTVTLQDGSTVNVDDDYLRESILTPQAKVVKGFAPVMPTFKGQINEEGILQLIAYIKSLGNGTGAVSAAGSGKTGL